MGFREKQAFFHQPLIGCCEPLDRARRADISMQLHLGTKAKERLLGYQEAQTVKATLLLLATVIAFAGRRNNGLNNWLFEQL